MAEILSGILVLAQPLTLLGLDCQVQVKRNREQLHAERFLARSVEFSGPAAGDLAIRRERLNVRKVGESLDVLAGHATSKGEL